MHNVLVLMSVYNGERYIEEQLDSLFKQENVNIKLNVRDDGSSDNTLSILNRYKNEGYNINICTGENLKPAKSFLWLVNNSDVECFDYFAYCDQDDFWLPEKLESAINRIGDNDSKPILYYCAAKVTDEKLNNKGLLFTDYRHTSSLIDSIATGSLVPGCTMVFNKKLMQLLRSFVPEKLTMHDTWTHLLCLSCGGEVIADPVPHILYRQHEANVLGTRKKTLFQRIKSIMSLNNIYSDMVSQIVEAYKDEIDLESKEVLISCVKYRKSLNDKLLFLKIAAGSDLEPKDKLLFIIKILISVY